MQVTTTTDGIKDMEAARRRVPNPLPLNVRHLPEVVSARCSTTPCSLARAISVSVTHSQSHTAAITTLLDLLLLSPEVLERRITLAMGSAPLGLTSLAPSLPHPPPAPRTTTPTTMKTTGYYLWRGSGLSREGKGGPTHRMALGRSHHPSLLERNTHTVKGGGSYKRLGRVWQRQRRATTTGRQMSSSARPTATPPKRQRQQWHQRHQHQRKHQAKQDKACGGILLPASQRDGATQRQGWPESIMVFLRLPSSTGNIDTSHQWTPLHSSRDAYIWKSCESTAMATPTEINKRGFPPPPLIGHGQPMNTRMKEGARWGRGALIFGRCRAKGGGRGERERRGE